MFPAACLEQTRLMWIATSETERSFIKVLYFIWRIINREQNLDVTQEQIQETMELILGLSSVDVR
jgi:hypothetical protein